MKRRLTNQQRQAIKNWLTLLLSISLFLGAFVGMPYFVKGLPDIPNYVNKTVLSDNRALAQTVPVFALGTGKKEESKEEYIEESVEESEVETEESEIPAPIPQEGDKLVTKSNLCWYDISETPALNLINRTNYSVDLNDCLNKEFPISGRITVDPLVLIITTHGSESYLQNGYDFYSPDEDFRSNEESETVVHIGELLCNKLNSYGIPTIQDKTMHDIPNYNSSYVSSSKAIEEYLAKYPSIKYVIDIHRDSVFDAAGNNIKPYTEIDGKPCAQLMIVMGTDAQGIPHPNWRENLVFASYLQEKMNIMYPTLARPVNLRTAEFNQSYTKGSIILEVGSCGNTLEEAENAISFFAQSYALLLLEQMN